MAATINSDLKLIMDLIKRIEFFKSSMEEHILVASIEQELAKHFEFRVSLTGTSKPYIHWDYYIHCSIQYPNRPHTKYSSRLTALWLNLEFLRNAALNPQRS